MNQLDFFNQPADFNSIPLKMLVEQIELRANEYQCELNNFDCETVSEWLGSTAWNEIFQTDSPFFEDDQITKAGCRIVARLLDPDLEDVIHQDICKLFRGVSFMYQVAHSAGPRPLQTVEAFGAFAGIPFEPAGCTAFKFENGVPGISSKYLEAVSQELFNQGQLEGKTPRLHKDVLEKIREIVTGLSHAQFFGHENSHTYFAMEEGLYKSSRGREETHIWMSPDLCLLVAASEHLAIRARIIDDLNRHRQAIQLYTGQYLPPPSFTAYLPGTLENQYREKGLTDLLTGESLGYYPLARVKRLWAEALNTPEIDFDKRYDPDRYYYELRGVADRLGSPVLASAASRGGTLNLYHVSVLTAYFKDIDLSSLEC
jgi:hypothetical protein